MRASPSRALALPLLLLAALLVAGCARREPVPDAAVLQARSQALIEAGNTFYRAGDPATAAKRYAAAAVVKPDDPAAYFGLGMALAKLGRDEEARQAYARARELAQQARGASGDTVR
jgi:Flp pilus assembly protein TadD